ncbi:hypothetical protein TNCV_2908421 [Trichonephila clavipes]|nr:hypothetical protein TNCV_2908421 [Trichonephila clavipes]
MDDLPYYLSAIQYSAFCMRFTAFLMMISRKHEKDLNVKFQVQEEGSIMTDTDGIQPFNEMISFKDIFPGKNSQLRTATAGSDVVQSGRPIFDDFFQHLWPYIGHNTAIVVFQMVKRL